MKTMNEKASVREIGRVLRGAALLLVTLTLTSCDFEVTNPGPIRDQNLDDTGAHDAVVNGAMRGTLQGLSLFAHYGGAVVRDLHAGGHTGSGGVPRDIELGQLHDENTADSGWDNAHKGRWIGEHMAARIAASLGSKAGTYKPLGRFYLWAGYANRILGEHACTAVFDGGSAEPYKTYFTRAVQHFSEAERIAAAAGDEQARVAAIAGRAAAHINLGNWAAAATDAAKVPVTFSFQANYNARDEYRIVTAASSLFRSLTFWDTAFEKYFLDTGDPRAAWGYDKDEVPVVARPTWGYKIPMYYPLKFYAPRHAGELSDFRPVRASQAVIPVDLADGREMLLVRAEALLAQGDWNGAMVLINQVRTTTVDVGTKKAGSYFTGQPLAPVTASTAAEAWAALKFERLVEFQQEGTPRGCAFRS
ncbi:MAG: hypothetical protein HY701_02750 [Gemmatimonadetes bacterium]|nr:hypothetical protein [Gemmatimonadota bacterium]